jgi:farnesyl-diphosphate farnesyltransferase
MDIVTQLSLPLIRLNEFYILLRFYVWRRTVRSKPQTPSTWCNDRTSMRHCWDLLDKTGKSYAPAIKELGGELAQVVSALSCIPF